MISWMLFSSNRLNICGTSHMTTCFTPGMSASIGLKPADFFVLPFGNPMVGEFGVTHHQGRIHLLNFWQIEIGR